MLDSANNACYITTRTKEEEQKSKSKGSEHNTSGISDGAKI